MEERSDLCTVTGKLLAQVEAVLDEGKAGLPELKQVAAILKDVRDVSKETAAKETADGCIRVVLEGEVAGFGG
jgi:hypothetical protein